MPTPITHAEGDGQTLAYLTGPHLIHLYGPVFTPPNLLTIEWRSNGLRAQASTTRMPGGNVWHHSVSPTTENPTAASTLVETVSPDPSAWTAVVVLNEPLVAHRRRRQRRAARRRDRHRYRDPRAPVLHPSRGRHPYRRHAAPAVTVRPDGIDVHLERGTWRMAAVPSDDVAADVRRAVPLFAEAMIEARGAADRHVLRAADSATRGREDRVRALARSATLMIAAQCSADGGHSRRHPYTLVDAVGVPQHRLLRPRLRCDHGRCQACVRRARPRRHRSARRTLRCGQPGTPGDRIRSRTSRHGAEYTGLRARR